MFYIDVALPVPLRNTFVYLPQDNTNLSDYKLGARVQVPFGQRTLVGIIDRIFNNKSEIHDIDISKLKKYHKF